MLINKIVLIGHGSDGPIFCHISYVNGRLSIVGVEGPYNNGNCSGAAGQIIQHEWNIRYASDYSVGWDARRVAEFRAVWKRWHLNGMRAGSPDQERFLRENPVKNIHPENYYQKVSEVLASVGLNPDPGHFVEGRPYKYGSHWLYEAIPADVLRYLQSLPDSPRKPAWV